MAINMEKLVKDWFATWNSHDIDEIVRCYTDDCLYEGVAQGTVYHGKKEMAAYLKNLIIDYPDFKLEQKATFFSKNAVCGEFILSGTQAHSSNPAIPVTGKSISVRGAYISEWQNDKVKRHSIYEDYSTIMRQLGLMPIQHPPR